MLEEADSDAEIAFVAEINEAAAARAAALPAPPAAAAAGEAAEGRKRKAPETADAAGGVQKAAKSAPAAEEGGDREAAAASADAGEGGGDAQMAEGGQAQQQEGGEEEQQPAAKEEHEPGCLLSVHWESAPEGATGFKLRGAMGHRDAQVRFVEYDTGATSAIVRFETAAAAKAALEAFQAKPEEEQHLVGGKATLQLVEGDAEKEYYSRADKAARDKAAKGGGGGRGGGRGRG
ncbi:hypothetical protein MNEG_15377 [Monoraphidium neglectum]|uniref:XRRM domain-containing protein n=1 Tax=Monoraphidium neglectum TaxID=145388 RepID=A0A0D2MB82_9CHLO|nr:hypothetical protein MNEG_15377 [Monoraphidium neglectum]KIY92585.1 hypothetical protein MNEG_15377 [Monoraphidium neglectum]|eukprot:XP_013891605.1 hypothetical protein MNEG_15377 [Monoraphidium neglectum]